MLGTGEHVGDDVERQEPLLNDLVVGDPRQGGEAVEFGTVRRFLARAVAHDVHHRAPGGRQVPRRAVACQVQGLVQAHNHRRVRAAQSEVPAGGGDRGAELGPTGVDRQKCACLGRAAGGHHHGGSRQHLAVGQGDLPPARDGAYTGGGVVGPVLLAPAADAAAERPCTRLANPPSR